MRDSQSLLEQVLSFGDGKLTADTVHAMLGTADETRLNALATAMAERDAASVIKQIDDAIDAGVDAGRLAEQLLGYFRDLMAVTVGCDASLMRHSSASMRGDLQKIGEQWGCRRCLPWLASSIKRWSVSGTVFTHAFYWKRPPFKFATCPICRTSRIWLPLPDPLRRPNRGRRLKKKS